MFWLRDALPPGNYLQHISGQPLTTLKMRTQLCIKGIFVLNEYIEVQFPRKIFKPEQAKGNKNITFLGGGRVP